MLSDGSSEGGRKKRSRHCGALQGYQGSYSVPAEADPATATAHDVLQMIAECPWSGDGLLYCHHAEYPPPTGGGEVCRLTSNVYVVDVAVPRSEVAVAMEADIYVHFQPGAAGVVHYLLVTVQADHETEALTLRGANIGPAHSVPPTPAPMWRYKLPVLETRSRVGVYVFFSFLEGKVHFTFAPPFGLMVAAPSSVAVTQLEAAVLWLRCPRSNPIARGTVQWHDLFTELTAHFAEALSDRRGGCTPSRRLDPAVLYKVAQYTSEDITREMYFTPRSVKSGRFYTPIPAFFQWFRGLEVLVGNHFAAWEQRLLHLCCDVEFVDQFSTETMAWRLRVQRCTPNAISIEYVDTDGSIVQCLVPPEKLLADRPLEQIALKSTFRMADDALRPLGRVVLDSRDATTGAFLTASKEEAFSRRELEISFPRSRPYQFVSFGTGHVTVKSLMK